MTELNGNGDLKSNDLKPNHEQPGGFIERDANPDDGIVNDSLGEVNTADSTGLDEDKETGDAKARNTNTRED
jgi:hypothetical protein